MKRFGTVLCMILSVCLLAGAFSACGSKKVVEEDDGIVVLNNGDAIYHKDAANPSVLSIAFTEAGFGREWLVELSKAFVRENHDVRIELSGDPSLASSVFTKLDSGRNLSDIFMPLNSGWENYATRGLLESLDDVYSAKPDGDEGKTAEENMVESYRDWSKYPTLSGEHYYVLPWNQVITGIVYNKKMFREHGWEIPETTDDLYALCETIVQTTSIKPFAFPGKIGGYFDYIGSAWWMQASGLENYKSFFGFESEAIYDPTVEPGKGKLRALKEFERFFPVSKGFSVSGSMSKDHTTSQMDFMRGEAAMIVNGNWMEAEMKTNTPAGFEMGMMPVPFISDAVKGADGKPIRYNYATAPDYWMIPSAISAERKALAKKFMVFSLTKENLVSYTEITGSPRPWNYEIDPEKVSDFAKDTLEMRAEAISSFDYSRAAIYMQSFPRKYMAGGDPYSLIVSGSKTAEAFCHDEQVEAENQWDYWESLVI